MKFYDTVQIVIQSGKWGDGVIAGRREKYEAFGGPAWGDGGRGWSVIFVASENEYTLMPYRFTKTYAAKSWEPGQSHDKYGKRADDLMLLVPTGTVIKETDTWHILAYLQTDGQTYTVAKGGKGGIGNMHFKNPKNQYPQIALAGEPGHKKNITLELLLLGDVALIGAPSVGKSTLINAVSSVKAKTWDYPFTTLVPNIGVVNHRGKSFTIVDIPGLIEWAHQWKGLWNAFLRHILKARVFAFLLDCSRDEAGIEELAMLCNELRAYISTRYQDQEITQEISFADQHLRYTVTNNHWEILLKKAILIIITKTDELDDQELLNIYQDTTAKNFSAYLKKTFWSKISPKDISSTILSLSSFHRETLDPFLTTCITLMNTYAYVFEQEVLQITITPPQKPYVRDITEQDLPKLIDQGYIDESDAKYVHVWEVFEPEICYLTFVLPWWNYEAELRYWTTLSKEKHLSRLEKHGVRKWDILKIISLYDGQDDKYVLRD